MPFQKGHKLAKGGARPGAGRKSQHEIDAIASATQIFEKILTGKTESIAHHYSRRVFKSDQILLDARKKLWPDDIEQSNGQTLNIFIAQASKAAEPGLAPELRRNGVQIRIGGDEGSNGNGSNGA